MLKILQIKDEITAKFTQNFAIAREQKTQILEMGKMNNEPCVR